VVQADNISIISCKLFYVGIDASQNRYGINIQKCFFNPGMIATTGSGAGVVENLTVTNCFFRNDFATAPARAVINGVAGTPLNWRISHCTFYKNFGVTAINTTFANNAFFGTGTITANASNSYHNNVMNQNVAAGSITDGVNDNVIRTEAVGLWFSQKGANEAIDIFFTAAGSSSACPLRYDAGERGMYGGIISYEPSGMFNIPSVYDIQMDVEVGDSFDMIIKARTH